MAHVKKDRKRNIMNGKERKVFKTADNVCYLERKKKREENNKKWMLLFWSLEFSLNLKQEVRSVLLNFYPVSTRYFFPYVSIVEAGSQGMLICITFVRNLGMILQDELNKLKRTCI